MSIDLKVFEMSSPKHSTDKFHMLIKKNKKKKPITALLNE